MAQTESIETIRERTNRQAREAYARRIAARGPLLRPCPHCGVSFSFSTGKKFCTTCAPDKAAYRRLETHDLSQDEYAAMYFEQDGACPICLDREATFVDHDHSTGAVRALLCSQCNAGLGHFADDEIRLGRAIEFLGEHRG